MACMGSGAVRRRPRQQAISKPYQKKSGSRDQTHNVPSRKEWHYIVGQGLKARFVNRNYKQIQIPVFEPKEQDYDSDATLPYDSDMEEKLKAFVTKQMKDEVNPMISESGSVDTNRAVASVEKSNTKTDTSKLNLDMKVDPVSDPDLNACSDSSDSQSSVDIQNLDRERVQYIINERLNDLNDLFVDASGMSAVNSLLEGRGPSDDKKDPLFYDLVDLLNDDVLSDIDINACSVSSDSQSSVDSQNMDRELVQDIINERLSDLSVDDSSMNVVNNFFDGRGFSDDKNDPLFYGLVDLLNDDAVSDIDAFLDRHL